ncbi:MAG: hypothetical protein QME65_04730 [Candidatus Omnitrophota bacterium]|nr:hypothetical protein [Candidatus Omnitrophota bacterium]
MPSEQPESPEVKPQKETAPQAKPKAPDKPKPEEQTNCLICNKPIKRLTRYYRDGKFYCSKKCWRTAREKRKDEAQEAKK